MEWTEIIILAVSFFLLMGIGVPIAFCIGLATLFTMLASMDPLPAITTEAQRIATGLDSFALLAIPFFILAGQIMNRGGIARRLIDFARSLLGTLPGGLAHINILAAGLGAKPRDHGWGEIDAVDPYPPLCQGKSYTSRTNGELQNRPVSRKLMQEIYGVQFVSPFDVPV